MPVLEFFVTAIFVVGWVGFGLLVALVPFFIGWAVWDHFRHNDREELARLMGAQTSQPSPQSAEVAG